MIFLSVLLFSSTVFAAALPMEDLEPAILRADRMEFVPHAGQEVMDNWLAVNLAFAPIESLRKKIEQKQAIQLKHRSEAHITVLSPLEVQVLQPLVSMQDLHAAYAKRLQQAKFRVLCLGKFSKSIEGEVQESYFVVVQSEQLLQIRENILKTFVAKGGDAAKFVPLEYFPHITLGFTSRDLHASDGALKDVRSCTTNLRLRSRRSKVVQ